MNATQPQTHPETELSTEALAEAISGYAHDKKAEDVVELDLRELAGFTDLFLVMSGRTDRQVKAIADAILEGMKREHGMLPRRVEGEREARWVLIDYLDVVVHVFVPEVREFYALEKLWGEAPRRELAPPAT